MARLITCGWESGNALEGTRPVPSTLTDYATVTSPVRSGQYALQPIINQSPIGLTYGGTAVTDQTFTAALAVTYFIRFWIYFDTLGTADAKLCFVGGGGGGTITNIEAVFISASGRVDLRFNGVVKATSAVLAPGTWHLIELSANITSTTSDVGQLRINGVDLGTFTADAGTSVVPIVGIANNTGGNSTILTYDDLAINDSTGATQNSWPDQDKLVMLKPIADTA